MPEFTLSVYKGPASVANVPLPSVRFYEHAERGHDGVRKTWDGEANVNRDQAPDVTFEWGKSLGVFDVELPDGRTGKAFIKGMELANGRRWKLELGGLGPFPAV